MYGQADLQRYPTHTTKPPVSLYFKNPVSTQLRYCWESTRDSADPDTQMLINL